jgi:very-short-patch-repair endonuclease
MPKLPLHVLLERQRRLNQCRTKAETVFRSRLVKSQIRHHAQVLIGPFIADFVIPDRLLVIEIDGGVHSTPEAKAYDAQRTEYLIAKGFSVVRVSNESAAKWPLSTIDEFPIRMGKRLKEYKRILGELSNERNFPGGRVMLSTPTPADCPF